MLVNFSLFSHLATRHFLRVFLGPNLRKYSQFIYSFSHAACSIFGQQEFWRIIGQIFGQESLDLVDNKRLNQEWSPCWAMRKPPRHNCVPFDRQKLKFIFIFFRFQTRCTGEGAEFYSMGLVTLLMSITS